MYSVLANIVFHCDRVSLDKLLFRRVDWLFFFFKQKTAYEIRPRDWSSDVCSSDLDGETEDMIDDWSDQKQVLAKFLSLSPAEVARLTRSEERRVGKECRARWSPYH